MKDLLLRAAVFFVFLNIQPSQFLVAQEESQELEPTSQTKYVNELPIPELMQPVSPGSDHYQVSISQFKQELGIYDEWGNPLETTVWGYNGHYPGPTIETYKDQPIWVKWDNRLIDEEGYPLEHPLKIDKTIHWANPLHGIPIVTHLHGGHTEWESDGAPDAWYTPYLEEKGSLWRKAEYYYDNSQEAATLWYHDHAVGITRLNVYMGLSGFYLLRDAHEDGLMLPSGEYEVPLVIQDRSFYRNGELYYPYGYEELEDPLTQPLPPNSPGVTVLPEMFGDFILVNGKVWPYFEVEPRKYRLRILNGSDSRFYDLNVPGVTFYQIGSDGGLLNAPLEAHKLLIGPAERLDVIADFSAPDLVGKTLIMRNTARSPFPFGDTPNPNTTGQIMAFKVIKPLNTDVPDYNIPSSLRNPIAALEDQKDVRKLVLFEGTDDYGRLKPLLGTVAEGPRLWTDAITENPIKDDVEDWEIYNTTDDAHPIHLHLVQFQVVNTQRFDKRKFESGDPSSIELLGQPRPPSQKNAGWKDTYIVYPGEVARVRAKFDREGFYVWHCHILSHEDNDMMRPFYVGEMPEFFQNWGKEDQEDMVAGILTNAELEAMHLNSFEVAPNPVESSGEIRFNLKNNSYAEIRVYDFMGRIIATPFQGYVLANQDYTAVWDRQNLGNGTFVCKLVSDQGSFERILITR